MIYKTVQNEIRNNRLRTLSPHCQCQDGYLPVPQFLLCWHNYSNDISLCNTILQKNRNICLPHSAITHVDTHSHTHTVSLSLSLSHTPTHTHPPHPHTRTTQTPNTTAP